MKNKKIALGIVLGFVCLAVVLIGVTWFELRKEGEGEVSKEKEAEQQTEKVIYVNDEYGFKLTLPREFAEYRTAISFSGSEKEDSDTTTIAFEMPYDDDFVSYFPVFQINIHTMAGWGEVEKFYNECDEEIRRGVEEIRMGCDTKKQDYLGENSKYVFAMHNPASVQDYPGDFNDLEEFRKKYQINVENCFELLSDKKQNVTRDSNLQVSNSVEWKTYEGDSFSVVLPSDWKLVNPFDSSLGELDGNIFQVDEILTTISSTDGREQITFVMPRVQGPAGEFKNCERKFFEMNGQKMDEIICPDSGEHAIPGEINYDFFDRDLTVITNEKTETFEKIVSSIRFR